MAEFDARIVVGVDPRTVFDYLADFTNAEQWDPSVRAAKALGEGDPTVGSGFAVTTGFYGKAIELICEITELDSPRHLALSIDGGRTTGTITFTIEPDTGTGSIVHYRVETAMRGPARLLDRGLQLALSGMGESAAQGLEKSLSVPAA